MSGRSKAHTAAAFGETWYKIRGILYQDFCNLEPSTYRDAKSCAAATRQLLALPQRPTAILFPDDFSAIGGIQTIRQEGLLIPRDISVAGYDGNLISQIMSPQLTTYRQDTEALGRAAAELLIEQIESPRTALPEQKLISGSLLKGQSVDVPNP